MIQERKEHWENVYESKAPHQVSWTQEVPAISINTINSLLLPKDVKIIDIGGGDSKLVDHLIQNGYTNITILDISAKALERAKKRLGEKANQVTWIVSDITVFNPETTYDVWHDRATFHFLTTQAHIKGYRNLVNEYVNKQLIIGTFSENGPEKCSGLEITQYSEQKLTKEFDFNFKKMNCSIEDHITPFNTTQNFIFCSFKKK